MRHPPHLVSPKHCSQTTPTSKFPVLCLYYSFMQESNPIEHRFPQGSHYPQISDAHLMLLPTLSKSQGWNMRLLLSPFSLPTKGHHNPFFIRVCILPHGQGKCGAALVCVCVSHKINSFAKEAPQIIAWGIKKRDLDPNSDLDVNTLWSKILELKIITVYCNHHCCFKNKSGWFPLKAFPSPKWELDPIQFWENAGVLILKKILGICRFLY